VDDETGAAVLKGGVRGPAGVGWLKRRSVD
jgi:hypothetical protein